MKHIDFLKQRIYLFRYNETKMLCFREEAVLDYTADQGSLNVFHTFFTTCY